MVLIAIKIVTFKVLLIVYILLSDESFLNKFCSMIKTTKISFNQNSTYKISIM